MGRAKWRDVLDEIGARKELLRPKNACRGKNRVGAYYRFCRRCGSIFETAYKNSKVCADCDDSPRSYRLVKCGGSERYEGDEE